MKSEVTVAFAFPLVCGLICSLGLMMTVLGLGLSFTVYGLSLGLISSWPD